MEEIPETEDDISVANGPPELLHTRRPYEHFDYEISKVKNKNSAVLDVPVDATPSPFMRKYMPKDWQQTTAAEL